MTVSELVGKHIKVKTYDRMFDTNTLTGTLVDVSNGWLKLGNETFDGERTSTRYTYIQITNIITVNEN